MSGIQSEPVTDVLGVEVFLIRRQLFILSREKSA